MKHTKLRMLVEIALFAAIAFILDLLIPSIGHGIKINVKMLPIIFLALRWGLLPGMAGGLIWGILQIVTGEAYILSAPQAFIEYIIAFSFIGMAGLLHKKMQRALADPKTKKSDLAMIASLALILGSFLRYIWHMIAGYIFWSDNMENATAAIANTISVNGLAFITETVTCLVVLLLITPYYKNLLKNPQSMKKEAPLVSTVKDESPKQEP